MAARIPPPSRVRVEAGYSEQLWDRDLTIVHVGQSAVVLRDAATGALATLTDYRAGLVPGGTSIPVRPEFDRVRNAVAATRGPVSLRGFRATEQVTLALREHRVDSGHAGSVAQGIPAPSSSFDAGLARTRSRARDLAVAALGGDLRVVADLVGAGPGTTPTGDDMIVGALAALHLVGRHADADRLAAAAIAVLAGTTVASRHYLLAAAHGRFAEHLHELADGLERGASPRELYRRASEWGATSGLDVLTGLTVTLHVYGTSSLEGAA